MIVGCVSSLFLQSECLREAFSELDLSNESLEVLMSPDAPYLRLSTFGYIGSSHADYPKDSDMVDCFECRQTQVHVCACMHLQAERWCNPGASYNAIIHIDNYHQSDGGTGYMHMCVC